MIVKEYKTGAVFAKNIQRYSRMHAMRRYSCAGDANTET